MSIKHRASPGFRIAAALALAWAACLAPVAAGELRLQLDDGSLPVAGAVASLHAEAREAPGATAVMDQRDSTFVPGVLAVQVGTSVSFPNSDRVQHQVYSFSKPKPFELPLYAGTPREPVTFDRPGVVVVGCNIHDWMIGYIVVLDTPYFATSGDDGAIRLQAPPGRYTLRVWHSRLAEPREEAVEVGTGASERTLTLALGPPPPDRRGNDRLRALQDRLRSLRRDP
ncbi:MAG TPA: methylamine utilization protein [Arenimonas sp.]|uniref:methylamine utilization protein n=1 Tax=Arenimonas sp. TaxID=1872635 RepID=UPI002D80FA54|nr:methylamine utilization protein [Arenimonas sp.]HEU0151854.1 methylamine utilization protein [Arenimonas sp.]